MGLNIGQLTVSKTPEHQEMYTPYYAVAPLLKYVQKDKKIWCPFDKEWSAYYQTFVRGGYQVIRSHIDEGQDFFTYEPDDYDMIISNPPYSIKDDIIERLYELNKPFAVLLPLDSLQGRRRFESFKNGVQLLTFDQRIGFHRMGRMDKPVEGTPFAAVYYCKDLLPKDLIVERLEKFDQSLNERILV